MTKAATESIPYFITSASTFTILAPPKPVWRVRVADGVYWNHAGDKRPPNALHRLMHRLRLQMGAHQVTNPSHH